jgi:hypothetical protein
MVANYFDGRTLRCRFPGRFARRLLYVGLYDRALSAQLIHELLFLPDDPLQQPFDRSVIARAACGAIDQGSTGRYRLE